MADPRDPGSGADPAPGSAPAAASAPAVTPGGAPAASGGEGGGGGGGTVAWSADTVRPAAAGAPQAATMRLDGVEGQPPASTSGSHLAAADLLANRFRIVRFIGRGGMGDVYEAEDLELGERVALKTVRPEIAHLEGAVERFRREIHLARKVTHPNVCRIFDVFRHRPAAAGAGAAVGGAGSAGSADLSATAPSAASAAAADTGGGAEITFFSMELLLGETLEQRLRAGGRMRTEEALPIVRQVAEGLSAAHQAGVVHRDFKPANVMLCAGGGAPRAVITDFGLARTHGDGENLTLHGDILGTPSYMAPEQVEGGEVTAATDIYALGCVLYEMVTGRPPFVGANSFSTALKRLQEDPRPPHQQVPGLARAWDAAILRCLERDPADRFAQARDVAVALAGEELAPGPRRRRRARRRVLAAAMAAAALAGLAFAGARWLRQPGGLAAARGAAGPLATMFRGPEGLYAEGLKLLGELDTPRAQELFGKAVASRQDYWLAHSGLAVALAELGHADRAAREAKLAFDHAAELPPEQRQLVTARYWQVGRQPDRAVELYQQLQREHPDEVEYALALARTLPGSGRGNEALQLLDRLKRQPAATAAGARLDLAEAEVARSLSDFPRQAQAARRARELASRDGRELLVARALFLEGGALTSQGDRPAALDAFRKAEAIYAGTADQRSLAQVVAATAAVLYYQGKLEQAREKAKEALDSFGEAGDLRGQSLALDTLAAIEGSQGNLAGAQSRYATAVETWRRLGDRAHEAQATGNLGLTLKMQGKLDEAARRFAQALELDRQLHNRSGEAMQLFQLAGIAFNQLDLAKAESYLEQSSSLGAAIDDQTRVVDDLALAADVAAARGDLAAVRRKREEALTRGRGLGDKNVIAESQLALAELELERGRPSQAQAYAQAALEQYRAEHMADEEAAAEAALARALLAQHSLAEARSALARASRLAARSTQPEVKIAVAIAQARLAAETQPEEARRILAGALAQAQATGLGPLALEARLAQGELEAEHGDRRRAADLLAALEQDARNHGFILIADRAARARTGATR